MSDPACGSGYGFSGCGCGSGYCYYAARLCAVDCLRRGVIVMLLYSVRFGYHFVHRG